MASVTRMLVLDDGEKVTVRDLGDDAFGDEIAASTTQFYLCVRATHRKRRAHEAAPATAEWALPVRECGAPLPLKDGGSPGKPFYAVSRVVVDTLFFRWRDSGDVERTVAAQESPGAVALRWERAPRDVLPLWTFVALLLEYHARGVVHTDVRALVVSALARLSSWQHLSLAAQYTAERLGAFVVRRWNAGAADPRLAQIIVRMEALEADRAGEIRDTVVSGLRGEIDALRRELRSAETRMADLLCALRDETACEEDE
jgi:hypothetical protein